MELKHLMLRLGIVLLSIQIFSSCKTISVFDQYAYTQSTALKVDALSLMDNATTGFTANTTEIEDFNLKIQKVYEYEKHRPKNEITVKLWDIIMNPDKNLLGGFLARWKQNNTLGKTFINEAKIQVGEAFDIIVELESQKIKASFLASFI